MKAFDKCVTAARLKTIIKLCTENRVGFECTKSDMISKKFPRMIGFELVERSLEANKLNL
jgi:hypothetical protein